FPAVFASRLVQHQVVAEHSHLLRVQGSRPHLLPYMLLAHIDVVPASEADGWDAPPFSAQEGILQALEYLLLKGYTPRRGFYIGLGHDEEVYGLNGAVNTVRVLKQRGVQLSFVLDEGLLVVDGVIKGLQGPAALLEDNPMPMLFGQGPERGTFEHLAHKVNVLPSVAEAYVNLRIHSAQTLEEVLDLVKSTVGDQRVKVDLVDGFDPLPVSSYNETTFGFQILKKTILDVFPQVTVAPGICVGNTDSRHYKDLTTDIYRFAPIWAKPGDSQRIHGINERISKKNYEDMVGFYVTLIQNCDIKELPAAHTGVHEF
ncbi:hypothetical protein CRUP_006166, partial [Coryphaenoides rupestris]